MVNAHKLTVSKTAHFYTLGNLSGQTRRFWIVCHGYGQLAKTFIRRFEVLNTDEDFVLAPEGLSRFYWGGFTGNVVASWMTREDRLDEINDYCNYLQMLYDHYLPQMPSDVQIILLGFSQGCATQCRWIMKKLPHFHQLVLWAGLLPDDLDFTLQTDYFLSKKLYFVYGLQDEFLTEERLQWQLNFAKDQMLEFHVFPFEGGHEVDKKALQEFAATLSQHCK